MDPFGKDKVGDPELMLDLCELSVCLGNFTHNVCQSTKILEQHPVPLEGYSEMDLLNNLQERFEDAKEIIQHKARGNRFLQLYIELRDLEPDEGKRVQYLMLFYKLFDSELPKLDSRHKFQAGNISCRLEAGFVVDNVSSRNIREEFITTMSNLELDCFRESKFCPVRGLRFEKGITTRISEQIKTEGYQRIEGYKAIIPGCPIGVIYEKGDVEIKSLQNNEKSELQICKPETFGKSFKDTLPINYAISSNVSDDDLENNIINNEMRRSKSKGKYILKNDSVGNRSYTKRISSYIPKHNSSMNSDHSFLDEEYESGTETLTTQNLTSLIRATEKSPKNKSIQCLYFNPRTILSGNSGNTTNDSEVIKEPENQSETGESQSLMEENEWSLNLSSESWEESDHEMLSPIFHELRQTVSDLKIQILKNIDKSLSVLSFTSQQDSQRSQANATEAKEPMENSKQKILTRKEERDLDIDISEECQGKSNRPEERERMPTPIPSPLGPRVSNVKDQSQKVPWQHLRHIIIAPRVVIQLFKSNPAYKCPPDDPNAPNFYEQVNQLFEIIGQNNCSLEVRSIQSRLVQVLHEFKRKLPRDISYSGWVAAVGKYQLNQLLLPKEMQVYESLCWHLRDQGGQYPETGQSRFRDALRGMMGQESQHLKASPVTGRLQIRSPHHQESLAESYLLLTLGHLGYLYSSVKKQLEGLDQQGETAAYLVRSLRKDLLIFQQFVERRKCQPCSLLSLYWDTRKYQLLLQWLSKVLGKMNRDQAIVISLYEESSHRIGEQWRLIQMWLSEASKPLATRLGRWLSWGQLTVSEGNEFIIERRLSSDTDNFWQQRYRLTTPFSKFFSSQLSETMLSVGKTVAYSKKYLGRNVEPPLSSRVLNRKLLHLLAHFYRYGDQEPLFNFLQKLHSDVSGKVLSILRNMEPSPKDLFHEVHKYLMITDMHFYRQLMETLEALLEDPATTYNIKLFNMVIDQMLPRQTSEMYVDKGVSQGSKCWSCFLLRLSLPDHWRALLGEDIKEYEAIYSGLWKFHYANYMLSQMVARQELHTEKRSNSLYFDCIDQVDKLIDGLIDGFLDAMYVLKNYFLKDLLEPAYIKLRLGYQEASTLDEMLSANRTYLSTIKRGSFQTKSLRKCNMYLEQLYDCIMDLDFQEQKFLRLLQNFMDYLTKYGGQRGRNEFLIPSYELTDRKREFCWSCQNSIDAISTIKDQSNMIMHDLLYSLHLAEVKSFRKLAQKLDPKGYYEKMDKRLQLVQRFKFKRKVKRRTL